MLQFSSEIVPCSLDLMKVFALKSKTNLYYTLYITHFKLYLQSKQNHHQRNVSSKRYEEALTAKRERIAEKEKKAR